MDQGYLKLLEHFRSRDYSGCKIQDRKKLLRHISLKSIIEKKYLKI